MDENPQAQNGTPQNATADERLSKVLEELRKLPESAKPPRLLKIISKFKATGRPPSWDQLVIFSLLLGRGGPLVIPPFIGQFLTGYAEGKDFKSVLDPWAGVGSLLLPVAEGNGIEDVTGIARNQSELDLGRLMEEKSRANWLLGDSRNLLDSLGTFDLIVSSPPFGLPQVSEAIETVAGNDVTITDSESYVLALKAALHLTQIGEAIFVFPKSFFLRRGGTTARETLPKVGLFINAIIALPAGTFSPHTPIETNIVFISRRETADVFVGRLEPKQDPAQLLNNLKKRTPGPALELGRLVPLADYRSWQTLAAQEEVRRLAERSGLNRVRLSDVVACVNLGSRAEDGGFVDLPNSVYLPLIGTAPAVTAVSDFRLKPHNYAQLVVRPEIAYAEFLAGFFNSALGRKTRDTLLRGTFIPKITKQSLLDATIYLAPLEAQRSAVEAQREIEELQLRLGQLHGELWQRPVGAASIRRGVLSLTQKPSVESWIETLPFPLASVLWRYHATKNVEHKNVHLLNFFEASAQFLGALMTSAFHSNEQVFRARKGEWFEAGADNPHTLARSNFGEWVVRCKRLAKTTRQMLSSGDERQICLDLYKTSDAAQIEVIANKALYAILEKVGLYRNDWKGHTGIVSAKEYERRLTLLQEELMRFWGALGSVFERWWLIQPGTNQFSGGIFHYSASKLMGSRQIFQQVELETSSVMDSKELYFFDLSTCQPLPLLHFVRMMPSPESEEIACYFYNRLDRSGVRWVSYHFEGQAERVESDPAVVKIIREVEENQT